MTSYILRSVHIAHIDNLYIQASYAEWAQLLYMQTCIGQEKNMLFMRASTKTEIAAGNSLRLLPLTTERLEKLSSNSEGFTSCCIGVDVIFSLADLNIDNFQQIRLHRQDTGINFKMYKHFCSNN